MDEIYTITTAEERNCLARLAAQVPNNGIILEIGALYGGVTAILAQSQPRAHVMTIDNFSWHPEGMPETSAALVEDNLNKLGIKGVSIIEGDSRKIARKWADEIDLLWIDGGHSYEFVYSDLYNFGPHAQVIALHDYDNPIWATIRQAVETFISKFPYWYIHEVVGMVVVLRRK